MRSSLNFVLLVLLFWLTGCSRFDAFNATAPSFTASRTGNVPYGKLERQKLDVYVPYHAEPNARVVVFFYGGEWSNGTKEGYRFVAQGLASRGFVVVVPDYRIYSEVTFPSFVEDCALSVKWTHDNIAKFGGDPTHVYTMGYSAGAHIAALLNFDDHYLNDVGLKRTDVRASLAVSGLYDFKPLDEDRPIFNMKPGDELVDPRTQPISYVHPYAQPIAIMHGKQDSVVDVNNALLMADRIAAAGGRVTTIIYPERAHVTMAMAFAFPFRFLGPVLDDSVAYFNSH